MCKNIQNLTLLLKIVGSFPNFPYGIADPIEELALIAGKKKIGLHVDACLGGFVVAFARDNGLDLGNFDFKNPNVTSISCDNHKYGLAPKGSSVLLFRTKELRSHAYFSKADWSGGIYATQTTAGSRNGVGISGSWYALVSIGRKRYAENSKQIMQAVRSICENVK